MNSYDVSCSIVLFNNSREILLKSIQSFLRTKVKAKLYLIDNSPSDSLKDIIDDPRCEYYFNKKNLGFGKAHNIAMVWSKKNSKYHLVLNPDVYFNDYVISEIFAYMEANPDVGQLMPKVLYPNGAVQFSGKLLPTPLDLIGRRLFKKNHYFQKRNAVYELQGSYDKVMNVPQHLGCFMFIRTAALEKSGLFDEKMFMYSEDIDITRRIHQHYRTEYNPQFEIYHYYEKGSRKKLKLLLYHIRSTVVYFNKWGWFFDGNREKINKSAIEQYYV